MTEQVKQIHCGTKSEDHKEGGWKQAMAARAATTTGSDAKISQRGMAGPLPSELSGVQLCLVLLRVPMKSLIEMTYQLKHMPTRLAPREDQSERVLILMEERSLER